MVLRFNAWYDWRDGGQWSSSRKLDSGRSYLSVLPKTFLELTLDKHDVRSNATFRLANSRMGSTVLATANQGENEGLRISLATRIFRAHRSSVDYGASSSRSIKPSWPISLIRYQVEANYMISRFTKDHRGVYDRRCLVRKASAKMNASAGRQGGGQFRSTSGSEEEV